jgi:hypothetical protein
MTWVYALSTTNGMNILTKDRDSFGVPADKNLLNLEITATDGFMKAYLA